MPAIFLKAKLHAFPLSNFDYPHALLIAGVAYYSIKQDAVAKSVGAEFHDIALAMAIHLETVNSYLVKCQIDSTLSLQTFKVGPVIHSRSSSRF